MRHSIGGVQHSVGPYVFSGSDVRRTLAETFEFLEEQPIDAHQAQQERRARLTALLDGVDADQDDIDQLTVVLDSVWPELLAARDDRVRSGLLPARAEGTVVQLNRSNGGVPKLPFDRIDVGFRGVGGDRQATRLHHGRPFQALCLWSAEVIDGLAAAGHPIGYGSAGENVTISGLDWSQVTPGVRMRIGTVVGDISSYAVPCHQNARWFSDRRFQRIHHSNGPISRLYATVIEPGTITAGDQVVLEPS